MDEQLKQLMKMVNELQAEVKKGQDPAHLVELFKPELEKALALTRKPAARTGQFEMSVVAGRDMKFLIHGVTPKYARPHGWAVPRAENPLFTHEVEELHKLNDYMIIAAMVLEHKSRGGHGFEVHDEEQFAGLVQRHIFSEEGKRKFASWIEQQSQLAKALDSTTTAEGVEFVPTGFSRDLIDRVRITAQVASLFVEIQMPTDPFKIPGRAFARSKAKLLAESTADSATKITAVTPGTRNVQFDARKLGARVLWSLELDEDSIIAMAPLLRDELVEGLAYALEDADINGDTTATHQDTDTQAGAADLAAKAWIGLRKHALANTLTTDLSTFNIAGLRTLRSKLTKYGANPRDLAWVVSSKVLLTKLLSLAEVVTVDKYGPLATVVTGELAKLDGAPVIVSEEMRDDVDATGVNGATGNTKSTMAIVNRRAWGHGVRRSPTLKTKEDIETDQLIIVGTWRGDFQRLLGTAETHTAVGINI